MHGKIYFADNADLADFLAKFCGKCTATFEVRADHARDGGWILEFLGGY